MYLIETKMNNQDGHLKKIHVYVYLKLFPELIYLLESAKLIHRIKILVINSSLSPITTEQGFSNSYIYSRGTRENTRTTQSNLTRFGDFAF